MRLWFLGAYGAVSTTTFVGAKAVEEGLIDTAGLVTELPQFKDVQDTIPLTFEFGGHEIRNPEHDFYEAALWQWERNKHYPREVLEEVSPSLKDVFAQPGTALNCGPGVSALDNLHPLEAEGYTLREIVDILIEDMARFKSRDTVVVNLASTEPLLPHSPEYHDTVDGLEHAIDEDKREHLSASILYAYAAIKNRIPYVNFTPSPGSSILALEKLAKKLRVPHAGNDGKTGETLVKTVLAPLFLYRNMPIEGWMSYNILGDDDGKVLSHQKNKESKTRSKDSVLCKTLGYQPYSICDIEFFPSLVDNKIAFDFIHFRGFLGTTMKMYFIWDGIDSILAAPLVIDIARLLLYAKRRGEYGVIPELGYFFKSPMGTSQVNLFEQFQTLTEWVQGKPRTTTELKVEPQEERSVESEV